MESKLKASRSLCETERYMLRSEERGREETGDKLGRAPFQTSVPLFIKGIQSRRTRVFAIVPRSIRFLLCTVDKT